MTRSRVATACAAVLLAVQLVAAWPALEAGLVRARGVHHDLEHPDPQGLAGQPTFAALLDMPPLLAGVPDDARVLLVAGPVLPFAWDFYVMPRPLDVLVSAPDVLVARALRKLEVPEVLERWLAYLDTQGLLLTPDRLADALARDDVLIAFAIDADDLGLPPGVTARLQRVDSHGLATLYRIAPR
ncbi:MAG TPA: hypothetical protein VFY71_05835 [Planctomycetota bacterium]|nr:hypothetical protein [Planctomycetota bacterium]